MRKFSTDIQTSFIDKLAKVEFTKDCGDNTLKGNLPNGLKVKFSLELKLANSHHDMDSMPVQVVGRVFIEGKYAGSWGCVDSSDNSKLVSFFQECRAKAQNLEHKIDRANEDQATKVFENL